ncbi:MAG: S1 RNA-binding domain-containing protein [Candidatus Hydrogenedens sp.]|nr:S1 RNA-binding domain-containing protein [Candidatus Hydrogenedens sp.]
MIDQKFVSRIAKECSASEQHTAAALELFDRGATVAYVARFHKDETGGLDEFRLEKIFDRNVRFTAVTNRRDAIIENLQSRELLNDELRARLEAAEDATELEDLYTPFKKPKRTKGAMASSHGLEPLADLMLLQAPLDKSIEAIADEYVSSAKHISSPEAALDGACQILAERFAADTEIRMGLRTTMREHGILVGKSTKLAEEDARAGRYFKPYFDFHEPLKAVKPEQLVAILRGGRQGFLRTDLLIDDDAEIARIVQRFLKAAGSPYAAYIQHVAGDAYRRLLRPALESEVLSEAREKAEDVLIETLRDNLRHLLLTPPAGNVRVLGVSEEEDGSFRLAVVHPDGTPAETGVLRLGESQEEQLAAKDIAKQFLSKNPVDAIAVANSANSRKASRFLDEQRRRIASLRAYIVFVNEAGLSAYAASKAGRDELPELDAGARAAVAVARRFQDPLREYVKLEPRTLGLGQHAHDVSQKRLRDELHRVLELVVSHTGVDLNTAPAELLRYVSGIQLGTAQNIVAYRTEHGPFTRRETLAEVSGIGERTLELCAGFLRIARGEEPLDATSIHPKQYELVRRMAADAGLEVKALMGNEQALRSLPNDKYFGDGVGELLMNDIKRELQYVGRDGRRRFRIPRFDDNVRSIEQLEEGMVLEGIVTNVTDFGAFVDIGIHQDGLIHLSELVNRYVRNPRSVVHLGELVRVKVIKIDKDKSRVSLSRKAVSQDFRKGAAPRPGGRAEAAGEGEQRGGEARGGQPGGRAKFEQRYARGPKDGGQGGGDRPQRGQSQRRDGGGPRKGQGPKSVTVGGDETIGTSLADQLAALRDKFNNG